MPQCQETAMEVSWNGYPKSSSCHGWPWLSIETELGDPIFQEPPIGPPYIGIGIECKYQTYPNIFTIIHNNIATLLKLPSMYQHMLHCPCRCPHFTLLESADRSERHLLRCHQHHARGVRFGAGRESGPTRVADEVRLAMAPGTAENLCGCWGLHPHVLRDIPHQQLYYVILAWFISLCHRLCHKPSHFNHYQ